MPIQKSFTMPTDHSGNHWVIEQFAIRLRGGTPGIVVSANLYKDAAAKAAGKTPMTSKSVILPLNTLSGPELAAIRTACQNALVAGAYVEFSGGTIV